MAWIRSSMKRIDGRVCYDLETMPTESNIHCYKRLPTHLYFAASDKDHRTMPESALQAVWPQNWM